MKHIFLLVNFCEQITESNETSPNIIDPKRRVRSYWFQGSDFILRAGCMTPSSSDSCAFWLIRGLVGSDIWLGPDYSEFILKWGSCPTPSSETARSILFLLGDPWYHQSYFSGLPQRVGVGVVVPFPSQMGQFGIDERAVALALCDFSTRLTLNEIIHQYGIRYHHYVDHTQLCISPTAGKQLLLIFCFQVCRLSYRWGKNRVIFNPRKT